MRKTSLDELAKELLEDLAIEKLLGDEGNLRYDQIIKTKLVEAGLAAVYESSFLNELLKFSEENS